MIKSKIEYICYKMKELREERGYSLPQMAIKIGVDKSTLSRVENNSSSEKNIMYYFDEYCKAFNFTKDQIKFILNGFDIMIPDTSALINNPQLIEELDNSCRHIVVPDIVVTELTNLKKREQRLTTKAWKALNNITNGKNVSVVPYVDDGRVLTNDQKIIDVARNYSIENNCDVVIITNDVDYSAYLKSDDKIKAIKLDYYMATKQELPNMELLVEIDNLNILDYSNIKAPENINAYLPSGYTLIISTILSKLPFEAKKAKIKWLLENGNPGDINIRDNKNYHFPPLTHAVQKGDYKMAKFLLNECGANPNVGSRNPYCVDKLRQQNEGNMPLMVACWHGFDEIVELLCNHPKISLNQQDFNGYTAYIKASIKGYLRCRNILEEAGADLRIVDINGKTGEDHYDDYLSKKEQELATRKVNKKW